MEVYGYDNRISYNSIATTEITTVHEMECVRQIRLKYSYTTIFIMTLLSSKCEHKNFGL